jgi:hypothetical protein
MKAKADLVLTKDRGMVVEAGDPDGFSGFPVARKGEDLPDHIVEMLKNGKASRNKKADAAPNKAVDGATEEG